MSLEEFITFECDIRKGKLAVRSRRGDAVASVLAWWRSMKSETLRSVIITHFQLSTSIMVSFPDMDVSKAANSPAQAKIVVDTNSNSTTSFFKEALNDAAGTVTSLNVAVLEYIGCFVGPRHESRLVYSTMTAIGLLLAASVVPWAFRRASRICFKRITLHTANYLEAFDHYSSKGQLILIFLVYPALTTRIMRTFVCQTYAQDDQGNPTKWLVDDTTVQCWGGTAVAAVAGDTPANTTALTTGTTPYVWIYAYSWVMVIVVVLGFPAFLYLRLWSWRYPFNRMYFIDEDGHERPTPAALEDLDTIVMFRSGVWATSIADMFFKFLIVSFIGVVFQSHQVAGAVVTGLCCVPIMAFFAFARPYLYAGGNYVSTASYLALTASFVGALTEKLEYDKYEGWKQTQEEFGNLMLSEHFKNLLFITWLLPYIIAFADMVNAPTYFKRVFAHCRRRWEMCKVTKHGAQIDRVRAQIDRARKHATTAAFHSDHKRGVHILSIVHSLLPIVRNVVHAAGVHAKHVRAKQKHYEHKQNTTVQEAKTSRRNSTSRNSFSRRKPAWDENRDAEATLAIAKELDAQLRLMITSFSNGGSGERGANGDAMGRVRNLIGNYQPLLWHHFIDVETAARKLSKKAFPHTDVCHRTSELGETGKPGIVRKSFAKRHVLWSHMLTEQMRSVQEESRRTDTSSDNENASINSTAAAANRANRSVSIGTRATSTTYGHPNMRDIATW